MKIAKQTAKKILIILLIAFGGLTLIGGSIFTIGMSVAGWDFSVMNTVNYEYKTYTGTQDVTRLELDFDTNDIKVYFDETATQVRVEYAEKYTKKGKQFTQTTITEENGVLKINQEQKFIFYTEFSVGESSLVSVYLPKTRAYDLDIETDTGDIWLNGNGSATNVSVNTDTGDVFINGEVSVTEKAELETETGDIFIRNTLTAPSVEMETGTGDVWLGRLSGQNLAVKTSTGDVRNYADGLLDFTSLQFKIGTGDVSLRLIGKYTDYCVDVKTNTGDVHIAGYPDSTKTRTLIIRTSTGDIHGVYSEQA